MSYNFMQGKSLFNNSMEVILCILLLFVVVQGVQAAGITANFSANITTGAVPLTVKFTDKSTGSSTGWAWFFGDEKFTALWKRMNASAGWTVRAWHSSVAMPDSSIVLMGGMDNGFQRKNDVWRSTDKGAIWKQVNASAGWSERFGQSSVVMSDGSIVLMGGYDSGGLKNDTWRSIDNGATWTLVNASSGWTGRAEHESVVMKDGSIVLMGGQDSLSNTYKNDVWRSTDRGATWTQVTPSAGWSARTSSSSVAMPDGSIVLMGGYVGGGVNGEKNDTWRSTDNGASWTQVNASAWPARYDYNSVAMPDGSIVVMGGTNIINKMNDVWRSTDMGTTWTLLNASAGWSARYGQSSVAMPDGSIVLMGGTAFGSGGGDVNDVWRVMPAGSLAQNPTHTYTTPGIYSVALQAYNSNGFNSTRKASYITAITVRPIVTTISPASGPTAGGTRVTVMGTGFTRATAVRFGTTAGTRLTVNSSTKITITSPAHATGAVDVTVTTPNGVSTTTVADGFTYAPRPIITGVSPRSGPQTGGTMVTITGTGFTGVKAVKFGAIPAFSVSNSVPNNQELMTSGTLLHVASDGKKITVISPAHAAGIVDVRVTTPGGTSTTSAADGFTYSA